MYTNATLPYLVAVILIHAGRVVHCNEYLVLPLAWLSPPQPDPIILKVAGYVGDDPAHVQPLPSAEISPIRLTSPGREKMGSQSSFAIEGICSSDCINPGCITIS